MNSFIAISKNFIKSYRLLLGILLVGFAGWWFCLPKALFDTPYTTVVSSREGQLLGARIADDGQWRFPEIDSIPYRFKMSLLYFEDEYFYHHFGINPASTLKAFWHNLRRTHRHGGSTISQQLMRLSRKNKARTYKEKLIETLQATRLETRYKKEDILNRYASHAPFGGNVVGLPAASWRYFGVAPENLSWGQATALAVLPNAPSLTYPGKNQNLLKEKRNRLLKKLFDKNVIDQDTYELALEESLPGAPLPLPDIAPHFTEKIRKEYPGTTFRSSLNYPLQQKVNAIVNAHYHDLKQNQIHNMAVVIMEVDTRRIIAYVGNTPTTADHKKDVDIIQRKRSTGSILKPFLNAMMMDDGELLPHTLVSDVPTNIDGYTPKNFDKMYRGVAPASTVLTQSLNVPSVRLLQEYGLSRFYNTLKKMNLKHINKSVDHYGLSLILGGAESTLWEVTNAYAGMASILNHYHNRSEAYYRGEFNSPVLEKDHILELGGEQLHPPYLGAGAVYSTLEIIKNLNRPEGEENWENFSSAQPIAWKTGTSYGFKDAWAVGVTPKYAIGVWAGNANGEGRPGLVGVRVAAPVLFDVLSALPKSNSWFQIPYDDMVEAETCIESGHLAGLYCTHTKKEWIPQKGVRTLSCPYHQQVFLDQTEQYQVNSSCYPVAEMKSAHWLILPPVQEFYYRNTHSDHRSLPPYKADCIREDQSLMAFIYPKPNQSIILPKNFDEETNEVIFKLAHRGQETKVYWYLDQTYLGRTQTFHEMTVLPDPGEYVLTAIDQEGNEIRERIRIKKE